MAGVEFLDQERDDEPSQFVTRPRARRVSAVRTIAAAAAVIAALAVWGFTRPSDPTQPTRPGADPTAVSAPSPASSPTGSSSGSPTDAAVINCTLGAPVESEVASAMHRFLPTIIVQNLNSWRCVRGTGTLSRVVSEIVRGTYRGIRIGVSLTAPRGFAWPDSDLAPGDDGAHPRVVLGSSAAESAGLKVLVTATGRRGATAPTSRLRELADFLCLNVVL